MADDAGEEVIRVGTWLYDGRVPAQLRIIRQEVSYGTGDYEDPPDIREDREGPCFVIHWGSPGEQDTFKSRSASYPTIEDAVGAAEAMVHTIEWQR